MKTEAHKLRRDGSVESIALSIASPEVIRSWSYGEVENSETLDARTRWPIVGGLYCQRIFGPIKNLQCVCGHKHGKKELGAVCERCGFEVGLSEVRRERMGHIELAMPVSHIWFLRQIALILGLTSRDLKDVIYYCQRRNESGGEQAV